MRGEDCEGRILPLGRPFNDCARDYDDLAFYIVFHGVKLSNENEITHRWRKRASRQSSIFYLPSASYFRRPAAGCLFICYAVGRIGWLGVVVISEQIVRPIAFRP